MKRRSIEETRFLEKAFERRNDDPYIMRPADSARKNSTKNSPIKERQKDLTNKLNSSISISDEHRRSSCFSSSPRKPNLTGKSNIEISGEFDNLVN